MREETWERALASAVRQFEHYVRQGRVATEAERRLALADALEHAIGIIRASERRERDRHSYIT